MSSTAESVIEARGLSRRFGSLLAVDEIDLDVYAGEVFGFLGPNGAGKSTLLRMLVGLLHPTSGSVRVLGLAMPAQAEQLRRHVGYMTQRFSLYEDLSVEENLEFAAEIFGLDRGARRRDVAAALEEYELGERRRQRAATLSGGWRQRLALAAATVHKPRLLFLDEPTAGVDPDARRGFWEKLFDLAGRGTTVLVSTHYMDEAARCHRLCMVRDGRRVAVGRPDELTSALAGRTVEVVAEPVAAVIHQLQARADVVSATQLGNRIHTLLHPAAPPAAVVAPQLIDALVAAGIENPVAVPTEPLLEDAFVAILRGEDLAQHRGGALGGLG